MGHTNKMNIKSMIDKFARRYNRYEINSIEWCYSIRFKVVVSVYYPPESLWGGKATAQLNLLTFF